MGEALKKVQDAYAEEVNSEDPDLLKLKRFANAINKLGGGKWCHHTGVHFASGGTSFVF